MRRSIVLFALLAAAGCRRAPRASEKEEKPRERSTEVDDDAPPPVKYSDGGTCTSPPGRFQKHEEETSIIVVPAGTSDKDVMRVARYLHGKYPRTQFRFFDMSLKRTGRPCSELRGGAVYDEVKSHDYGEVFENLVEVTSATSATYEWILTTRGGERVRL